MKKATKVLVLGALLGAAAAPAAHAVTIDLNMCGASAEYSYWTAQAPVYLTTKLGCAANPASATYTNSADKNGNDGKHFVVEGKNCANVAGAPNVTFRVSNKSSYDGIWAVQGVADSTAIYDPTQTYNCPADQRPMLDSTTDNGAVAGWQALKCKQIHLGASDVAAAAFNQYSEGNLLGPRGGAYITRDFSSGPVSADGLTVDTPLVVPFAFVANKSITVSKCDASTSWSGNLCSASTVAADCAALVAGKAATAAQCVNLPANGANPAGNYCTNNTTLFTSNADGPTKVCTAATVAADCGNIVAVPGPVVAANCVAQPLDNITREMAVSIFGGKLDKWSDLGSAYAVTDASGNTAGIDQSVVVCYRHAGSGSHATLDKAIMHDQWGSGLPGFENKGNPYIAWFNDSTDDLMKCVNGQTATNTTGGYGIGAIGYADADKGMLTYTQQPLYNGVKASRSAIIRGVYDFFTVENLVTKPATLAAAGNAALVHGAATGLIDFILTNPSAIPGSKKPYWALTTDLLVNKADDFTYPTKK